MALNKVLFPFREADSNFGFVPSRHNPTSQYVMLDCFADQLHMLLLSNTERASMPSC